LPTKKDYVQKSGLLLYLGAGNNDETLAARIGVLRQMPAEMAFHIVRVRRGPRYGSKVETSAGKTVIYSGLEMQITLA
jgi:hypothetical protein